MTAKEAYEIIKKEMPYMKIRRGYESNDFFWFDAVAKEIKDGKLVGGAFTAIDKDTKEIFAYQPFDDDFKAFDESKELDIRELND